MTKKQRYNEWDGAATARLRAKTDLDLIVFGMVYNVRAVPYDDGAGPHTRIEFWRDGVREISLFATPQRGVYKWERAA